MPTRSPLIESIAAAWRGDPAKPIPNPTTPSIAPTANGVAPAANSQSATSPAVRHSDPATTGRRRPTPIGQAASERRGDRAHPGDPEQDQPGRLGRPALQPLDQQRDEDERGVEDDGRPEDTQDRRGERPAGKQARVNGRPLGTELEADEQDEEDRHGRQRGEGHAAVGQAADGDQDRDQEGGQQDETRDVDPWPVADGGGGSLGPFASPDAPGGRWAASPADRHGREQGDGHGDHEQRAPPECTDEQAADERADRRTRRDQHVEQAERPPRRSTGASARTRAIEVVEISAPLSAWKTRAAASSSKVGATAANSDATANARTPIRNTRRWPYRSPRLPLASRAIVTAPR